ncbi:hypothetical protein GAP32_402 [Cronobacter phage vB_CsaM_GAP32]|uniref:Uncharacterized protein n=1 Tax=Cronobacter phage vB_CsaM_GAP32 TaxID=1141136 RepID=K4F9P2_9CAUD|nr:hypothetical protein GAP32_402 [Cronobacter phage vB_CsaM_GAP32]AFC21855.1 hypothetical protein GAP32_402 [Cronobacter phage vB_CsaM_GAP32]
MGSNVVAEIKVKLLKQPRGVKGATIDMHQLHEDLETIVTDESFNIQRDSFVAVQECRWYSIEEDMRKLSAMYPGVLFTVKSDVPDYGEEPTVEYFYEGKTHKAVITYSSFDESLLQ